MNYGQFKDYVGLREKRINVMIITSAIRLSRTVELHGNIH